MNKGMGGTTLGAVVLAGVLFQAKPGSIVPSHPRNSTPSHATGERAIGEGPWMASCRYWSAAQSAGSPASEAPPDLDVTLHVSGNTVNSHIKTAPSAESSCGSSKDGWGIPAGASKPEITAIVATIPDPVHSHLALDFDRSVDAILLAAADNKYLSSYYWLPWRTDVPSLTPAESVSSSTPKQEDSSRESQPGLIILRYSPDEGEWVHDPDRLSAASYNRVIYLFLVGETPALGVNGTQLQNAFKYERFLSNCHEARLSRTASSLEQTHERPIRPPETPANCAVQNAPVDQLSVIGPFFSGSAASLHVGLEAARRSLQPKNISISGITGTTVAARELESKGDTYQSFGENAAFEQRRLLTSLASTGYDLSRVAVLSEAGTVFGTTSKTLSERGNGEADPDSGSGVDLAMQGTILRLRFPRELSLLRNAQGGDTSQPDASAPPTPFLNLSLKDYTADDTVPRFSTAQSPLSIEAQLMAIAHQLQRARTQFILFSASNILDDIFLAQFLHRACPDARLVVFNGGDLLFERDVDNAAYVGSISISPYLLTSLDFGTKVQWLHSDYQAEAIYNAASYAFWDRALNSTPSLAGYRRFPVLDPFRTPHQPLPSTQFLQVPLWAAVVGTDGYYPLAVLNWCGSDLKAILPTIYPAGTEFPQPGDQPVEKLCSENTASVRNQAGYPPQNLWQYVPESINRNSGIAPSLVWMLLDSLVILLCILHSALLWSAHFWSPSTRDLAVDHNDQPHRRSVYLNIGTSVLAAAGFVTAYPLLLVGRYYHLATAGHVFAWITLVVALAACCSTAVKSWPYRFSRRQVQYGFFNLVAVLALVSTVILWVVICGSDNLQGTHHSYAGLYFSYRCLEPLSGVCPLLPILLLLFAWYLWSICQTARLRFSEVHRPRIPRRLIPSSQTPYDPSDAPYPLYVPEEALERCERPIDSCLYDNMTCLLITREVIDRFCNSLRHDSRSIVQSLAGRVQKKIDHVLLGVYLALLGLCIFASHIHSLDHFIFTPMLSPVLTSVSNGMETHYGPTTYEFLVTALFFPLIMVALSGWFRTILIWGALRRGLLEPLERMPIRFAFSHFKGSNWVSMLSESGLHIRWRDMGRTTESIRQLVHHPFVQSNALLRSTLSRDYENINTQIRILMISIHSTGLPVPQDPGPASQVPPPPPEAMRKAGKEEDRVPCLSKLWDRPRAPADEDLCTIYAIEEGYATFCTSLMELVLLPHWDKRRTGLVEASTFSVEEIEKGDHAAGGEGASKPASREDPTSPETAFIHIAEELIVLRYVALIRAVLVNMRYLMLFVSAAFVLAIIAWNSYPFQPQRLIDWSFTTLLLFIGAGFIGVFAQMHRNAILSRITDTRPDELGRDFYFRIITFGAIPVLTWLAYQFPEVGGTIFKFLRPGLEVMK